MTLLAGYADRLSVRPGETIRFHVSNGTGTEAASPSIVRVISADPNPAGPGIRTRAVDAMVCTIAQCLPQSAVPGSYGVANLGGVLDRLGSLTVIATICPTRIAGEGRPIVTCGRRSTGHFAEIGDRHAVLRKAQGPNHSEEVGCGLLLLNPGNRRMIRLAHAA